MPPIPATAKSPPPSSSAWRAPATDAERLTDFLLLFFFFPFNSADYIDILVVVSLMSNKAD